MSDLAGGFASDILVVGALVIAGVVVRKAFDRFQLPSAAGFILLGLGLAGVGEAVSELPKGIKTSIEFLSRIGVVVLLFRVGLESNLAALFKELRAASIVWAGDITLSAGLGFLAVWLLTDWGVMPAVFTAAAMSATSIGVSTVVWRDRNALDTEPGALLVDVAELDDISAMILISLLFAVAPLLGSDQQGQIWPAVGREGLAIGAKLLLFLALCVVFSKYAEARVTDWFARIDPQRGPVLLVAGAALLIAAFADFLGLSLAIGALFAGLAFSRDPREKRIDRSMEEIYSFFAPFFFVAIGMAVDLSKLGGAVGFAIPLFVFAVAGKLVGAGLPTALLTTPRTGLVVGASMVPRAEIALIAMSYGLALGSWAVPQELYGAVVLVCLATSLLGPLAVQTLLSRAPPDTLRRIA